jgi:hypothetical protein
MITTLIIQENDSFIMKSRKSFLSFTDISFLINVILIITHKKERNLNKII